MIIKPDEYMVTHNDKLGVVYSAKKGILRTTTPDHAEALENCLKEYLERKMPEKDRQDFEEYLGKFFGEDPDLPIEPCQNLMERKELNRLEIMVATDCNLRCRYCYAHGGNYGRKPERLSPETAYMYLTKLLAGKYRRVRRVTFFGGEPTLCPGTIQAICEFFKENTEKGIFDKMPYFLMVSNGTLIDEKMADLIHTYDIGVTISIDGPEDIHDLNRVDAAGNGSFERVSLGIDLLNKVGTPPALLEATYTAKHRELGYTAEEIWDYLRERFNIKNVVVADCLSGGEDESLAYERNAPSLEELEKSPFPSIDFTAQCLNSGKIADVGCDVAYGSFSLLPNGDIYPCHFFVEHEEFKIADFHDGEFDFSGYPSVLAKFDAVKKSKHKRCGNCWAKQVCSYCPAEFLVTDSSEEKLDFSCNTTRLQQSHMILKCAEISRTEND